MFSQCLTYCIFANYMLKLQTVIVMLFYASLHPEWDCFGRDRERCGLLSELLETVATTHFRRTGDAVDALERQGVILGSGGFSSLLLQPDPEGQAVPMDPDWLRAVRDAAPVPDAPLRYGLQMGGRTYLLCCWPRLSEDSPRTADAAEALRSGAAGLQTALARDYPRLRIIVSDFQFGDSGIFRTFNDLAHALDFCDFRAEVRSPVMLDSEQQLHGALISDLSVYRSLSVQIAEQLSRSPFSPEAVADQICDVLMENVVPSMESVHYHIQLFMLTFTDYLGSSGLVDAAYMARRQIVYRCMAFERETEMRRNLATILQELHRQNRTLRTIGRQKRIQSVRDYVLSNIADPSLTVASVTERLGVSAAQLSRQFRYYYGVSLHRFLQQSRYKLAEGLLREHPDWSTRRVAEAAGYNDLTTMYRAFRTFGDITPGALRDVLRQTGPAL